MEHFPYEQVIVWDNNLLSVVWYEHHYPVLYSDEYVAKGVDGKWYIGIFKKSGNVVVFVAGQAVYNVVHFVCWAKI